MQSSDAGITSVKPSETPAQGRLLTRPSHRLVLVVLVLAGMLLLSESVAETDLGAISDSFHTFVTIFLGIFIEAAPFLLAGSVVSGFIEIFIRRESLARFIPRQPVLAAFSGALLGLAFPVCECGVVPVMRRLHQKGLPLAVGIAFLLSAPVINPVVILSTYAAFGWGPMLFGRVGLTLLIAFVIGLLFQLAQPDEVILPDTAGETCYHAPAAGSSPPSDRAWTALNVAGDDFLDMARYLVVGSMLAAGMQTLVPQSTLLALGQDNMTSILVMLAFAFILSVCSTVDAFLALAFVNVFTPASILGFLVFGPMVDVKSSLMFLGVFRRRTVAYLILLPFMLTVLAAVFISLNVRW